MRVSISSRRIVFCRFWVAFSCRRLFCQQIALPLDSPAIAGQPPVTSHDTVARDCYRERVRPAGLRHCTNRLRRPDALGDVRVARRGTYRNFAQPLPNPMLERGAADIERQFESDGGGLHEADHLGDKFLELSVSADQPGMRKAVLKIAH